MTFVKNPSLGIIFNLNLGNYMDKREKYWVPMLLARVVLTHEIAYILLKVYSYKVSGIIILPGWRNYIN